MAKKKDYIVYVEEVRQHEIKVQATTDSAAEKAGKKVMKAGKHKASKVEIEVVDVEEVGVEEEEYGEEWGEEEE